MRRWLIRIGILFLLLGLLLVSPAADLMPVGLLASISQPAASTYFRVVPAEPSWGNAGIALLLIGLVLICLGILIKRRAR